MASLPPLRRLTVEDYKNQSSWISRLLYPLNVFMQATFSALNHGLTFTDNFLGQWKTVTIKGNSPSTQFAWNYPASGAPMGVIVTSVRDTSTSPATVTTAVTCAWSYASGTISIDNITGLDSTRQYSITFLVMGA